MIIKCTSCGASQQLSSEKICTYCSSPIEEKKAEQNYKTYMSSEIGNLMSMAETSIEASNMEEALQFLNRVLEKDITNTDAWLGKGIAAVNTSTLGSIKINEAISYWNNAIKHAENPDAMGKRVAKEINLVVNSFYPMIENHFIEFRGLDKSLVELVSRFELLEQAQSMAINLDDSNIELFKTGRNLCHRVVDVPEEYFKKDASKSNTERWVGALSDNQYQRQRGWEEKNKYESMAELVFKAKESVAKLEKKYVDGIRRLDPSSNISYMEKEYKVLKEQKQKQAELEGTIYLYAAIAFIIFMVFIDIFS